MKKIVIFSLLVSTMFLLSACTWTGDAVVSSGQFSSDEELSYDWGDINIAGGDVEKTFVLKNTEKTPLLLQGAVTSCLCTQAVITFSDDVRSPSFGMEGAVDAWSYLVQPGESFSVSVVFDPMAHGLKAIGPMKRTVEIIADPDPGTEGFVNTRLSLSGNVLSEEDYLKKDIMQNEQIAQEAVADHHDDDEYSDMPTYEIRGKHVLDKVQSKEKFVLIDVREDFELEETGVIDGAIQIPLGSLSLDTMTEAGISKDDEIVVYCRSGNRSRQAYELLNVLGYGDVKSMRGGIVHWLEDKRPLIPWQGNKLTKQGEPDSLAVDESAPKISFDREVEDLGMVGLTEIKSIEFVVSNEGKSTLEIGNIATSCACTSAEIDLKSIEPGDSTVLTVIFDPTVHEEPVDRFKRTVF